MTEDGKKVAHAAEYEDHYGEFAWRWRRPGADMQTWHASIWETPYRDVPVDISAYLRNARLDMLIARIDSLLSKRSSLEAWRAGSAPGY